MSSIETDAPPGDAVEPHDEPGDAPVEVVNIREIHHEPDDGIHRFLEWQDHQYDPGHFRGGRLHPSLTRSRLNPFGWWALGIAVLYLFGLAGWGEIKSLAQLAKAVGTALLITLAALRLLTRPASR